MADKPETSAKEDSSGSGKGSSLPIVAAVVFMGAWRRAERNFRSS